MESAADLSRRLEEISATIEHQKQVLRDLEKGKSEVQGRLNAILDPITRLPLEISSEIFLRCAVKFPTPNKHIAPLVFLSVCHSWSNIAQLIPALWAGIRIHSPRGDDFPKLMERWISRALSRSLRIALHNPPDSEVLALVHVHSHRVEALEAYLPCGDELDKITTSFPALRTLVIGHRNDTALDEMSENEYYYSSWHPRNCVQMLCAAPDVVDCTFDGPVYDIENDFPPFKSTTHSNLRHLRLRRNTFASSTAVMLRYLTLPALESLDIPVLDISCGEFLAFLDRSLPPLCSLRIEISFHAGWSADMVQSFLHLVPSLTSLELDINLARISGTDFLDAFLKAMEADDCLPNLRTLTFYTSVPRREQYERLVGVLTPARACQLETFRVVTVRQDPAPGADVVARLRERLEDGIDIHVGPEGKNYI
ncbi:hypothetical protein C8R43DRAFT_976981 [Mycena crocata]|nr:hypothetical protein C8R43DRAFT_976981 [Mycena crocata]